MKTVVFVETNFSGLDALAFCHEKGYHCVLITDNRERFKDWFPESTLYKLNFADEIIDVKDSNNLNELEAVVRKLDQVDAVVTFAEIRTLVVANLARKLGLLGSSPEAIALAQDKAQFRTVMNRKQIDQVFFRRLQHANDLLRIKDELRYPFFIKPAKGHSSIGALSCQSEAEVEALASKLDAIESEGISCAYVLEEFLSGPLYSVELLTSAPGQHHVIGVADRNVVADSIEIGSTFPVAPRDHTGIIELAKQALDGIGYDFGASHVEVIMTENGPHLVEINTRLGGSGHSVMIDYARGGSIPGQCVELALGQYASKEDAGKSGFASWQCFVHNQGGKILHLPKSSDVKTLPGIKEAWKHHDEGDELSALNSNFNWIMQVMAVGDSANQARARALSAIAYIERESVIEEVA